MQKISASVEGIRNEIQHRISISKELDGDCKDCRAPTPYLTDPDSNNGCNWTVDVFPGVIPGCLDLVKTSTREVMAEYELVE